MSTSVRIDPDRRRWMAATSAAGALDWWRHRCCSCHRRPSSERARTRGAAAGVDLDGTKARELKTVEWGEQPELGNALDRTRSRRLTCARQGGANRQCIVKGATNAIDRNDPPMDRRGVCRGDPCGLPARRSGRRDAHFDTVPADGGKERRPHLLHGRQRAWHCHHLHGRTRHRRRNDGWRRAVGLRSFVTHGDIHVPASWWLTSGKRATVS